MPSKTQEQELREMLEILRGVTSGDALTNKRFNGEMKNIASFLTKWRKEYLEKLNNLQSLLEKKLADIDGDNSNKNDLNKKEIESYLAQVTAAQKTLEATIAQRLSEIKDGKDADEELVVDRTTERVKEELFIPTTEDLLNDVPVLATRIRDALELLQEDERLDASAIKGLESLFKDWMKDVDGKISKAVGSISVPSPTHWQKNESFTVGAATSSITLEQAPGQGGNAIIVWYQGQALEPGNHYSVNGTDVNFSGVTFVNSTTVTVSYWP